MKQESASDPTATTWAANAGSTRTVDLNYFADSSLQSISRTQGTAGTTPIVSTYTQTTDNAKNEGRIASIVQTGLYIGSTATNLTYDYSYDDQGRVSSFTTPAGTRNYTYDSFNQVTGATGGTQSAEAFAYDRNGNRTGTGVTTSAYNRVTNDGTYTYLYDNEGNRIRRTLISNGEYETCDFDYRQRLVRVTKKSVANAVIQTVDYEYDGLDRRIRRTVSIAAGTVTEKQRFLYDSNVLQMYSSRSAVMDEQVIMLDELVSAQPYLQVDHRYMNGPAIDQVFADEGSGTGNQVLWYLSDQQNTVRDVAKYTSTTINGKATVYNHLEYDSFGNVTSVDNPTTATANDGHQPGLQGAGTINQYSPQRSYTGREPDSATGLIYYRARWYDPQLGRFISEDPIGFAAGDANLSRYVGNSTPNAVDPSGMYNESGHFYTTYFVGRLSGMNHVEARQLAIYSQLPDEVFAYDAYSLFMNRGKPEYFDARVGRTWNSADSKGKSIERDSYIRRIQQLLHTLTGEESMDAIEQRRNKLEVIIKSAILSDDKLLAGLAIHALGDSYAHTKFQGVGTYPCGIGHGTRSIWGSDSDVQPDQIRKRPELHREYMERLTKIMVDARMRKDHVRSDEKLNEKLANLKRFTDEMYDKLANARSDADEIEALSEGVRGNFYSYTYSESNYTKTPFRPENFDPKYPPGTGKTGSYPLTIPTHGQMEKVLAEIQKQIPLVDGVIQGLPNASITNEY